MWDIFGALSDDMANVGMDPTPNIDLHALLDPIKEQCPILRHLQGVECRSKLTTYEMVQDFHILMKVGVFSSDNVPLSGPSTYFCTDPLHTS